MGERDSNLHGLISPRAACWVLGVVLAVSVGLGGWWRWRCALPAKVDALPAFNALAGEASGISLDSPDNALPRYRALWMDTLGLPGAMFDTFDADVGNALYRDWRTAQRASYNNLLHGEWGDPRHGQRKAVLAGLRPILDALDSAADAPAFRAPYTSSHDIFNPAAPGEPQGAPEILLPHLSMLRQLGLLNTIQMRASAHAGDWDDVARRVRTGMRTAGHAWSEPVLISALVGVAIEALLLEEVRMTLLEHDVPGAACDALIAEIEGVGEPPSLVAALRGERLAMPAVIRWVIEEASGTSGPASVTYWQARFNNPPPRAALRDGQKFYEQFEAYAAMTHAERAGALPPNPGKAAQFVPGARTILTQHDIIVASRAATLTLLRLERFHAAHGRWPASLAEAMPEDQTIEPVTGAPFVYRPGPDAAANAAPPARERAPGDPPPHVGARWPFTLMAPQEATTFLSDPQFTRRRTEIEPDPEE